MKTKIGSRRKIAVPMTLEFIGVLEHRRVEFERKFGRPPQPGEPLFFDPEAAVPRRLSPKALRQAMANVLMLSGMPEQVVAEFVANY